MSYWVKEIVRLLESEPENWEKHLNFMVHSSGLSLFVGWGPRYLDAEKDGQTMFEGNSFLYNLGLDFNTKKIWKAYENVILA
jgi:hypothetical protein